MFEELAWLKAFEDAVVARGVRIKRREPIAYTSAAGLDVVWLYTLKHPTESRWLSQGITTLYFDMGREVAYLMGDHVARKLLEGQ